MRKLTYAIVVLGCLALGVWAFSKSQAWQTTLLGVALVLAGLAAALWPMLSNSGPLRLVQRTFTVNVPLEKAWDHLAQAEHWPSWAKHIQRIEVQPAGPLGPKSAGLIHLQNGMKSEFRMVEFQPHKNWKWAGPLLWFHVVYDHKFTAKGESTTEVAFLVDGSGFGVSVLGRLIAMIYARNLDRALPNLIAELGKQ